MKRISLSMLLMVPAALNDVRAVLAELGLSDEDLTTELYTDAWQPSAGSPMKCADLRA